MSHFTFSFYRFPHCRKTIFTNAFVIIFNILDIQIILKNLFFSQSPSLQKQSIYQKHYHLNKYVQYPISRHKRIFKSSNQPPLSQTIVIYTIKINTIFILVSTSRFPRRIFLQTCCHSVSHNRLQVEATVTVVYSIPALSY